VDTSCLTGLGKDSKFTTKNFLSIRIVVFFNYYF